MVLLSSKIGACRKLCDEPLVVWCMAFQQIHRIGIIVLLFCSESVISGSSSPLQRVNVTHVRRVRQVRRVHRIGTDCTQLIKR